MALRNPERWDTAMCTSLLPVLGLLKADAVTEIEVNGWDQIYAKGTEWRGHKLMEGLAWPSPESLKTACATITEFSSRIVNENKPVFDGRLPGGERVNIAFPPFCERCSITIRKFPADTMTPERLEEFGSINGEIREMIGTMVLVRKNILVSGGTNSGKTSFLNAASRFIPENQRVVTVEDSRELQMIQANWVALETVQAYRSDMTEVSIAMGVKNTLRMTPDRIIVGECRDESAFFMLRANSTGHSGGLSTVHADSAPDGLDQIQLLAQFGAPPGTSEQAVAKLVSRAVDVVIHVKQFEEDDSRKVVEIIEMERPGLGYENGAAHYRYRTLLRFDAQRVTDASGETKIVGCWVYPQCPSERFRDLITYKGYKWPANSLAAPEFEEVAYVG